jgi:ribonuclease H / adenosylcobalamin/alpha-ribazole phosphatase
MATDSDTSILLVRHGATAETDAQRYPSTRDLPLSERGRDQVTALAAALHGVTLDAVFASPSQRARETAASLASQRNLEVQVVPELAEMGFGQLGGMSFAEAVRAFPKTIKRWVENPFEVTLPEGEPFLDFVGRVRRARRQITREWAGGTIAVVAHGGVVAVWRCLEEGRPWSDFWRGVPAPGTGVWLIRADGQMRIETLRPEA